jgi:hypothetical protein
VARQPGKLLSDERRAIAEAQVAPRDHARRGSDTSRTVE